MTCKLKSLPIILLLSIMLATAACAPRYEFKPIPVRSLEGFGNRIDFGAGLVGAHAIYDPKELTRFFGFDLKKAGVVPVQIAVKNNQPQATLALTKATLLDAEGLLWEVLPPSVVVRRINEHTSGGLSGEQGARRTLLWGLAGGILGATIGVVSGSSVGEAAAKGAAVGGAVGATSSIVQASSETSDAGDIQKDFATRDMDHATVSPGDTANGLLYFPSEISQPKRLNLTFRTAAGDSNVEVPL
ncbi:MAG: hypothetical protein LBF58_10645 [Deltaproteobacteria bacterium]|jgi:hypothetical protein|nr:hypothetical protein [Deltaproteobacteria bacterium]